MLKLDAHESAIRRGIKTAGIGKKGSKPLSADLAQEILFELKEGTVTPAEKGAFFGSLLMKGLSEPELILAQAFPPGTLTNPLNLAQALAPDAPEEIQQICSRLINKEELDRATARTLGDFLLSDLPGDGARGLAASILRVRYETADEYDGILESLNNSFEPEFKTDVPAGEPIIQIAEPFDGVDQSFLITPLIGAFLQKLNYRIVHLVGRNSGPKFGNNLLELAKTLNCTFLKSNQELRNKIPFGFFLNQQDLSGPMDKWVNIRQEIIKRPFMATLERFVNPVKAQICLVSAFHAPYGEKMLTIAERAGYPGAVVIRNGLEGTLAAPLLRPFKILCSARQKDGNFLRNELTIEPQEFIKISFTIEEVLENPSLEENARLIQEFSLNGKTNNAYFDSRVKVTCEGIRQALEWIEGSLQ